MGRSTANGLCSSSGWPRSVSMRPLFTDVDALLWRGPTPAFPAVAEKIGDPKLLPRVAALAEKLVS